MTMTSFLHYFFGDVGQVISLAATGCVWLGLSVIGSAVGGRRSVTITAPFLGWAVVVSVMTIFGVFTSLPFSTLTIGLGFIAIASGIYVYRRDGRLIDPVILKLLVLTLPLWLLTAAMDASQWDEFSHWLPSAQFLLDYNGFPNKTVPITGASFPAYPYGWPMLSYFSGFLAGHFLENAGAVLNLFVLLSFGILLLEVIDHGLGLDEGQKTRTWPIVALGALTVTAFNPTFVQKLILTAYSDNSTAVTIGVAGVFSWMMLNKLAEGDSRSSWRYAWQAVLILMVHVNLRQTNLVLFLMLLISLAVVGLRDPDIRIKDISKRLIAITLPPLILYFVWRYHVATNLSGSEFTFKHYSKWHFDLIPNILSRMALIASKKGVYFTLMIIVLGFGLKAFIRFGKSTASLDRLAIMASCMFIGFNFFLFFAYLASFGEGDALRAASYWRYNTHAGMFGLAFAALGLAMIWNSLNISITVKTRLGYAAILLILAAPLVFAKKLRFDLEAPKPFYRAVATDIDKLLPLNASYLIYDPGGSGESGVISRFEIGRDAKYLGVLSAFNNFKNLKIEEHLKNSKSQFVLVHSVNQKVAAHFGLSLKGNSSYLFKLASDGSWRQIKTWPHWKALSR
jgi:hypothetical protein